MPMAFKMDVKKQYHYNLTKDEFIQEFKDGVFQWFFELGDEPYTVYVNKGKFILHTFFPPCSIIYQTDSLDEMTEYIYGKGTPVFFES